MIILKAFCGLVFVIVVGVYSMELFIGLGNLLLEKENIHDDTPASVGIVLWLFFLSIIAPATFKLIFGSKNKKKRKNS